MFRILYIPEGFFYCADPLYFIYLFIYHVYEISRQIVIDSLIGQKATFGI